MIKRLLVGLLAIAVLSSAVAEEGPGNRWSAREIAEGDERVWSTAVQAMSQERDELTRGLLMVVSDDKTSAARRVAAARILGGVGGDRALDWCMDNLLLPGSPPARIRRPEDLERAAHPVRYILIERGVGVLPGAIRYLQRARRPKPELRELATILVTVAGQRTALAYLVDQRRIVGADGPFVQNVSSLEEIIREDFK